MLFFTASRRTRETTENEILYPIYCILVIRLFILPHFYTSLSRPYRFTFRLIPLADLQVCLEMLADLYHLALRNHPSSHVTWREASCATSSPSSPCASSSGISIFFSISIFSLSLSISLSQCLSLTTAPFAAKRWRIFEERTG